MPRDILSEYGKDSSSSQRARATSGGVKSARDVNAYRPPYGPTNINDPKGPGLHGQNYGTTQKKTAGGTSGEPGLHGKNRSSGTQRG